MDDTGLAGRSILIVEDETVIAMDLACACEEAGALVVTASNLQDATHLIDTRGLSAAVIDFGLVRSNSSSLCQRLNRTGVPYVIHSGYSDIDNVCSRGIVVPKPADARTVVAALAHLLA